MNFNLRILGINSATPAHGRFLTSQVLHIHQYFFLIDCGEGTQMRLRDFHVPFHRINQVFISHLHGDHVFGLPGLILSYALMGRKEALDIFSPAGLEQMIWAQLKPADAQLPFPIQFYEIDTQKYQVIYENNSLTVHSLPLSHRIPTTGYIFREKPRPLNIKVELIEKYSISVEDIKGIKAGADLQLSTGIVIPNKELTLPPIPPRSFAYVTDTVYQESIIPFISGVNMLYHETTFLDELAEYAAITRHSTARQAATIALKAKAGKLITGHYSTRYKDLTPILEEASAVFPNTELGIEGEIYEV